MKSLVILLGLLFHVSAMAEFCSAYLQDGSRTLRSFEAYGYSFGEACNQARNDCQWELNRLRYPGHNMFCTTENRPDPRPIKQFCTYQQIEDSYGYPRRVRVISEHTAKGNTEMKACQKAHNKCLEASRYNRFSRCVKKSVYNPIPNPGRITKSCRVEKIAHRNNRIIDVFYASATGQRNTDVQRKACAKATRKCEMSGQRGFCRVANY